MNEHDQAFFRRELASFVPDRIFDAHCHIWPPQHTPFKAFGPAEGVDESAYVSRLRQLLGVAPAGALFLSFAEPTHPEQRAEVNEWTARHKRANPRHRGLFFVCPDDDPEWVRDEVDRLGLDGLKCYHTFAARERTFEAEIPEYLPEEIVRVAHQQEWAITLHMVRNRAVADESNLHWIRHYCRQYPGIKLILAHSARGFQPAHNLEGLPHLADLENLYFDASANCEAIAHQAVIRYCGHERLLYGSDYPVSHLRGRQVAAADSFLWLYESTPVWDENQGRVEPVLVGLEHLRSLKWACWSEKLGDPAIEDIFYRNAAKLFELP